MRKVLAIETSCDETSVSVVSNHEYNYTIHSNIVASQIKDHSKWGGVVPELAARKHLELIPNVLNKALESANLDFNEIDVIASTVAPGLVGCLRVGSVAARSLCMLHSKPYLGIHHLEGHLASVLFLKQYPRPPYLVLLASGGHTELIKLDEKNNMERLGRSFDDAAGEAFDKVGRLLGLEYPGGPAIERIARNGDPFRFDLPK
ncbi:MAG: tRNA (adenosine(37)-N6)-threonylcarbamoyltransferase complex transferase subunit TsaD, partial [Euryarchaeota archaeon]|nr:tRNA (adenosine(37)-N6)-threonylcarbamoyltransferase complex transferase subunit TsaD [Euryarchaeota archaeon]